MGENEPAEIGQGLPGRSQDGLERQSSWALPEIAPSPCSLVAWGRSDLGQTCVSTELASIPPLPVTTLQSKDIVHAAGSMYNSAFVTRELLLDIISLVYILIISSSTPPASRNGRVQASQAYMSPPHDYQTLVLSCKRGWGCGQCMDESSLQACSRLVRPSPVSMYCAGDGELYTSGTNSERQLGVRGHSAAQSPVRVAGLEAHTAHCVACGESHMLAVIDNGSLAAWGSNEYGQLGTCFSKYQVLLAAAALAAAHLVS